MVPWLIFVWAAVLAACTAGFGFGVAAFTAVALGLRAGPWWVALAQAHGHIQIFGWGGLMVLGVGFYFLPRLRGVALAYPRLTPWILLLMVLGLAARALGQPWMVASPGLPSAFCQAVSGLAEFCAAAMAVLVLALTARRGPSLSQRRGLVSVLPLLAFGFLSLGIGLAINALLVLQASLATVPGISAEGDYLVVLLGLDGFLVPISIAVAARSFPLFLRTEVPSPRALQVTFWVFAVGLMLRVLGYWAWPSVLALGTILEGASLIAFAAVLRIVPFRRRQDWRANSDSHYIRAVEYLLVPAFVWLVIAGVLYVDTGISRAGFPIPAFPDAERHALGSGFVTLLIFGMGQRMLPGFAGRQIASRGLIWVTAVLGNGSAVLRVTPVVLAGLGLVPPLGAGGATVALALSGAIALCAVACFAANLVLTFRGGKRN